MHVASMILRRLGKAPSERAGACTACNNCPDVFETPAGDFAVIGREATADLSLHLPFDVGVVPDRVFRLETRDESLVFCLEIDRGTMPVVRTNPGQSSFYRKLLAYHETWRSGLHVSELGWRRFRVLTLTSSPERPDHLVSVCAEVVAGGGSGLFMFAEKGQAEDADLASVQWLTGDGTNVAKLLSETRG